MNPKCPICKDARWVCEDHPVPSMGRLKRCP
jgi:hypothetical protein